jgi:soluble lytic murein transglycosylase-like protein
VTTYSVQSDTYSEATASKQGGCLSGFLLPPLAVVGVGIILTFVWLGLGSSAAAAESQNQANIIQENKSQNTRPIGVFASTDAISPIFSPQIQYWGDSIEKWANSNNLDPNLVATVMQIESCGDPQAYSGAGAIGLFQVMPYHFTSDDNPYDPSVNAARGLAYLKRSLEAANGDARLALAGYNGGIGVIGLAEAEWAAETQRYAYWGSGIYAEASSGALESPRLQEWMTASGLSLCHQASARLGIKQ